MSYIQDVKKLTTGFLIKYYMEVLFITYGIESNMVLYFGDSIFILFSQQSYVRTYTSIKVVSFTAFVSVSSNMFTARIVLWDQHSGYLCPTKKHVITRNYIQRVHLKPSHQFLEIQKIMTNFLENVRSIIEEDNFQCENWFTYPLDLFL